MTTLLGPTRQRVDKAAGVDVPIVDQRSRRQAFRVVDVIETMGRRGKLHDFQAAAFRRFEKDYTTVHKSSVLLGRYGAAASGSGTPLSQLANDLLCPEERRADAYTRVSEAALAVGEPRTVEALILVVSSDATLEDIGRVVLMIGNRPQAKVAAERTLQMGTYGLARHYGLVRVDPG
jgi:hypothetical protein